MECKKEENLKDCPCTYPGCEHKGVCCECLKHHLENDELPGCCFPPEAEKPLTGALAILLSFGGSESNFYKG